MVVEDLGSSVLSCGSGPGGVHVRSTRGVRVRDLLGLGSQWLREAPIHMNPHLLLHPPPTTKECQFRCWIRINPTLEEVAVLYQKAT